MERWMLSATLAAVLWVALPSLWLYPRDRVLAAGGLNVLGTLLLIADRVHAQFFGDPTSVSELVHASQVRIVLPSIRASLHLSDAWLFIDVVAVSAAATLILHYIPSSNRGCRVPRRLRWAAVLLAVILTVPAVSLAFRDPEGVFEFAIGRRQIVAVVGIAGYHVYDIVTHARYRLFDRWTITQTDMQSAETALRARVAERQRASNLWGVARDANVIIVQAESLQSFPIDLKIDGREVMPNLNALARQSLVASNFFDQTAEGSTSDAVFTVLQSLHPLETGAVATRYPTNHYDALPSMMRTRGYDAMALMGASGEFWNMRQLLDAFGFAHTCLDCPALEGLRFGQGLADGDFFRRASPLLAALREPFFAFLITVSNHHPYELPDVLNPMSVGSLRNTLFGRYLQSVHYFDESIGVFVRALADSGLLDRSVLVVYGDHRGYLGSPPEMQQLLRLPAASTIPQWEVNRRLPLLIRLPRALAAGVYARPAGHLDVAPTLLSMLGIEAGQSVMLGRPLVAEGSSLVVFRDGSFVTDGSYVLTRADLAVDSDDRRTPAGCYDAESARSIDCAALEASRVSALDELKLSDLILRGDLIPTLRTRLGVATDQSASPTRAK